MKTREALEQFRQGLKDNPDWDRSDKERQRLIGAVWAIDQVLGWVADGSFDDFPAPTPTFPTGKETHPDAGNAPSGKECICEAQGIGKPRFTSRCTVHGTPATEGETK
jgi:hypothetical protein